MVFEGDLIGDGDLLDDDFSTFPALIIRGNLSVRSWLRGGIPAFEGGSVLATGFVVGHYNDSVLVTGGDLMASGYLPRVKPYKDLPDNPPHQIGGELRARRFDLSSAPTDEELLSVFVPSVLIEDEGALYVNERAILEHHRDGRAVWRT